MKSLLLLCCLLAGNVWSQQPLIGVKDGQWLILQGASVTPLPVGYYDVGDFDEEGLTYFAISGKYGVLNSKGKVIIPVKFSRIRSQGHGYFTTLTDDGALLMRVTEDSLYIDSCTNWRSENPSWLTITQKKGSFLLNLPSAKRWDLSSEFKVEQQGFGYYSIADTTDQVMYFDRNGVQLKSPQESVVFYPEYLRVKQNGVDRVISESGDYVLPEGVVKLTYTDAFLQYSTKSNTVRVDPLGNSIFDVPFEDLIPGGRDRFIVIRNFKYGLIDASGAVLIPPNYNFLSPYGGLYLADTEQGSGIVKDDGSVVVPCIFSSVRQRGALYEVEAESGLKGLYSSISKKYLLEPKFRKIAISETKVRGWLNDQMRLVTYDEMHNVTDQLTIENPVSKYGTAMPQTGFDRRLFSVGWFYEKTTVFDNEGFTAGDIVKWGVRDNNDSIVAAARYPLPTYIPEMGFSLIYQGNKEFDWMGLHLKDTRIFGGIELDRGRNMGIQFISVDTLDGLSRDFVRFSSLEGLGYITKDNKVNKVFHIDHQDDMFVRFATSTVNEIVGCEDDVLEGIELSSYVWGEKKGGRTWSVNGNKFKRVLLPEAEWNFLSPTGTVLFERSFEFAERFKHETAIVKSEGNWGVVTSDSLIIPAEYSRIDRISELGDTVFLVMKSQGGLRFLDRKSNEIPLNIKSVVKVTEHFSIVDHGGYQSVINDQYEVISSVGETFRAVSESHFYTRVDRANQIFDAKGKHFATIDAKPRGVLFDAFVLIGEGSSYGLVDVFGDTIVPLIFTEIQQSGQFIVASGRKGNWLLSNTCELILDAGAARILVDSVTNNYAICENAKVKVYNRDGDRIWKGNKCSPELFVGNCLIALRNGTGSQSIVDPELVLPAYIKEVIPADEYGYLIETRQGFYFYDKNWVSHAAAAATERMEYLGSGVVSFKRDRTRALFSSNAGIKRFSGGINGTFSDGLLLMHSERKSHFITLDFNEVFDMEYSEAKPFNDGYSAVKLARGWTIIDANGNNKSLDSYGEIEVHGNGLFSTSKSSIFGIFESDGTPLLPVEYERIKVLDNDIIQAVKDGEIYYFKRDGTPLEY